MSREPDRILMIQTADAEVYSRILNITSHVNKIFCQRNNIEYEGFVGIKRGFFSWHACFNRIVILNELVQNGFVGWVFYLDADAYIYDLCFDICRYLADVPEPFIFAPGGTSRQKWDVNDGVFLINLNAPASRKLVRLWYENFMATTDDDLKRAREWHTIQSDQPRLHDVFQVNVDLMDAIRHEPREFLNHWNASFVRQILRSNAKSFEERVQRIKQDVHEVTRKSDRTGETGSHSTGSERVNVTRDEVIYAYRFLLGRDPENEAAIRDHLKHPNWMELRERVLNSAEFKARHALKDFKLIPNHHVDVSISDKDFCKLLKHVQTSWEILGREKPHWSVLTQTAYLPQNIDTNINQFYETGDGGIAILNQAVSRANRKLPKFGSCFELGCGVGRVTFALARHFRHVTGVDISYPHLSLAKSYRQNNQIGNVDLVLMDSLGTLETLPSFDFFYSTIVLQHNPPPLIDRMLKIIFSKINVNGMAYFQIPVAREGYRFSIDEYLNSIEL